MIFLYAFLILLAISLPLILIYRRVRSGRRGKAPLLANIFSFFGVMAVMAIGFLSQGASAASEAAATNPDALATGMGYFAAALSVGIASLGGGIAVAASATAALGALSENEDLFGKSLIFVGLAEGLALYGLLIAFMIISKL